MSTIEHDITIPDDIAEIEPLEPKLLDPTLALAAEMVDDIERVKTANANRYRVMTSTEPDADGEHRGFGLTDADPSVARLAAMNKTLEAVYDDAVKNLEAAMKAHPLGPWVKSIRGVGLKQAARLLAAVGDPYVNTASGRARTVSALWAYAGLHTAAVGDLAGGDNPPGSHVAVRRKRGVQSNWSTNAKTRAYLIAESTTKQLAASCKTEDGVAHVESCACSPFRVVYDRRRTRTAASHPDWTAAHSHADALRIVSKEILKELWREARRLHVEGIPETRPVARRAAVKPAAKTAKLKAERAVKAESETSRARNWARANGITVGDRGRLPAGLLERYRAAA